MPFLTGIYVRPDGTRGRRTIKALIKKGERIMRLSLGIRIYVHVLYITFRRIPYESKLAVANSRINASVCDCRTSDIQGGFTDFVVPF